MLIWFVGLIRKFKISLKWLAYGMWVFGVVWLVSCLGFFVEMTVHVVSRR